MKPKINQKMATGKKSFVAYADWKNIFDELPNEDAGKLIKHIFAYVNDENPESDSILIKAVFANIKTTLKRDLDKWESQLEQRKNAGRASAESRKNKFNETNERSTVVNETERNSTDSVSVNVNDSVSVPLEKETKKKSSKKNNIFIPPTIQDVVLYFEEKGYNREIATKAFNYYDGADWKDRNNNQVLNWKSKMQNNWFSDEFKIKDESKKIEYVTFRDQSFVKDERDRDSFEKMKIAMAGGGYVFTELKSEWR